MLQQIIDGYILHYVNTNGDHVSAVCFEYSVDLVATDPDWLDISDSYMERLNLKRYRTEESYDLRCCRT